MSVTRATLSAVTAVWVVALLAAGTTRTHGTWPVNRSTMFSAGAQELVLPRVEGRTRDGRAVAMDAAGFGLTTPQLRNWLARRTGAEVDEADVPALRTLARAWNARHPGRAVTAVRLWRRSVPLPAGRRPAAEIPLLEWEAR